MLIRDRKTRLPGLSTSLSWLLVFCLFANSVAVGPALADPANVPSCHEELIIPQQIAAETVHGTPVLLVDGETLLPKQVEGEIAAIMEGVKATCARSGACSDQEILKALETVAEARPSWVGKLARNLMRIPRRLLVLAAYATTVVGPGVLTYFAASYFHLDPGVKVILGTAASSMSGVLLGRSGAVIEKMIGPHVEQHAMMIWDPSETDSWGAIQKAINEKDRLSFSQMYNQVLTMRDHLMRAGDSFKAGDLDEAARHYAVSILHSAHLFGGLHYYHPSTVAEVRAWLPRKRAGSRWTLAMTQEQKIELILKVCQEIHNAIPDEVAASFKRDELVRFGFGVMLRWMVEHPNSETGPVAPTDRPPTAAQPPVGPQTAMLPGIF